MMDIASISLGCAAVGTALVGTTARAVLHPRSTFWGPLTWRGPQTTPRVALTFDDGPHPEATPAILDLLGEEGVQGAFFVIGRQAAQWPGLVKRMAAEGHLVGNHSYDHHHYAALGGVRYWRDQIERTDRVVADATGRGTTLFRPPLGFKTWHLYRALRQTGHGLVTFSLRAMDGFNTTPERVLERILPRASAGDIIVLHDGRDPHADRPRQAALKALRPLLRGLRDRGLAPVRLDDLIRVDVAVPRAAMAGTAAR